MLESARFAHVHLCRRDPQSPSANSPSEIWLLELEGAQLYTKLVEFPPGPRIRGITWTPDGSGIIIGEHDWTRDIVLLDSPK